MQRKVLKNKPESVSPVSENETYKHKEFIPEEMMEHNIFVKMQPKRRRTVKFKIVHIRRAKPNLLALGLKSIEDPETWITTLKEEKR